MQLWNGPHLQAGELKILSDFKYLAIQLKKWARVFLSSAQTFPVPPSLHKVAQYRKSSMIQTVVKSSHLNHHGSA